jgi:glycosyltransferase involved in cell wall biosynthesis
MAAMATVEVEVFSPLHTNFFLEKIHTNPTKFRRLPSNRISARALPAINELLISQYISKGKFDIIHESYYSGRHYRKSNCEIFYTIHDMIPELFPSQFLKYSKVLDKRKIAFQSSGHFIAISQNTAQDLVRLFDIAPERIRVIHHGIGAMPDVGAVTRRPDCVLYVGSRGAYKNFGRLVQAFSSDPGLARDVELVIFGGGSLSPVERAAIEEAGIRRFSQRGGDDALLARAYREATAFVYPSLYEGFGLPLLEAMSQGCPVVCSRASCFPEIVGDAARMFDPTDPSDIADALTSVLSDSVLQRTLSERGAERVTQFSWERTAREHVAYYNDVLALKAK